MTSWMNMKVFLLQGLLHRDIKPENIFLLSGGKPPNSSTAKLGDFGLAMQITESDSDFPTGSPAHGQAQASALANTRMQVQAAGTPAYTAPEILNAVLEDSVTRSLMTDKVRSAVIIKCQS